jgi:putative transposase
LALGLNDKERQLAYRELFRYQLELGLVDEIRSATNGNYALGGSRFQEQIADALGRRVTRGKAGRPVFLR